MYVPGKIKDLNNFVIDVGTGYYVEKVLLIEKSSNRRKSLEFSPNIFETNGD